MIYICIICLFLVLLFGVGCENGFIVFGLSGPDGINHTGVVFVIMSSKWTETVMISSITE